MTGKQEEVIISLLQQILNQLKKIKKDRIVKVKNH
jgi:hypothetical protein